jgi:hypothetical protein
MVRFFELSLSFHHLSPAKHHLSSTFSPLFHCLNTSSTYFFRKEKHSNVNIKRSEGASSAKKVFMALHKTEFKGINDLTNQRIEFLEKRLTHKELFLFKMITHEKERVEYSPSVIGTDAKVL